MLFFAASSFGSMLHVGSLIICEKSEGLRQIRILLSRMYGGVKSSCAKISEGKDMGNCQTASGKLSPC